WSTESIGKPWSPARRGKLRGFVQGRRKIRLVACRDIGEAAAEVLENFDRHAGRRINLVDGLYSGEDICAALGSMRGGEEFRWSAPPKLLMRLFAPEVYKMRVAFEENGRPPIRRELTDAVRETETLVPDHLTLDTYLKMKGWDTHHFLPVAHIQPFSKSSKTWTSEYPALVRSSPCSSSVKCE